MLEANRRVKSALLVVWALILTSLTFILGAVPLNGLYRSMGRPLYWSVWLVLSFALIAFGYLPFGIGLLSISLTVGLFNEVRRSGYSYFSAGSIGVAFTSSLVLITAYFWGKAQQLEWVPFFNKYVKENVSQFLPPTPQGAEPLNIEQLILQLPSVAIVLLISSLFLALLFERKVLSWLQIPLLHLHTLREFRVPEFLIWVFIASLFAAFFKMEMEWVNILGTNVLNVIVLLYFFQGLAVMATYFHITKTSSFWRTLMYVFATLQLFLAVALFGVMDYWFDFRQKMIKKMTEIKNS